MGERGDKERELAREAQARAIQYLERLEMGGPDVDEVRRKWRVTEEAALLHDRLADIFDREDEMSDG